MSNPSEACSDFVEILHNEIEQSQRLLDLLRSEYTLLQKGSPQALQALITEKREQLKQVEAAVATHNRFLEQQGYGTDRQGTETYIQQCSNLESTSETWHRFITLLEACHKQNEINGGAVQLNQRHVSQTLDILKGISQRDKTYGPSGESKPNTTSKSLGKA
ncbi:MAG: flagellar protein FlgN [Candidatus Thiodiazotropha sp. (ex Lucina aurantia)]|uniref:Flagellar protein FlgN n=1 Tax=Candidatus Thiodiazotropha taylori TaxID=2792791 RepID=A0A9E4JV31_9GAMM|nr:flagellar protein FlgN [Candidatus Thiodiazotropha sp. (ex Lucina pensylvanica)]MBT3014746.1 flagellar protein FlgN [Candidatus Thiodiazotropha taylori]MBT3039704.1 flagellar protein FlgN [Candidatus Thiodiazotropha sp. (ex Codakia orbicularis)]MBV2103777.1 flagellar protein FlgN [Candidatus Thiodiazotropha sp. (ex Lucina aurantia)]MCG7862137.1 flagellar protein FlgN [Candidatus Thiodiazotropha endolucinida]